VGARGRPRQLALPGKMCNAPVCHLQNISERRNNQSPGTTAPADSRSPTGQPGADLQPLPVGAEATAAAAATVAGTATATVAAAAGAAAGAAVEAAATAVVTAVATVAVTVVVTVAGAAAAGLPAPPRRSPRSEVRPRTSLSCLAWRARLRSCPGSATPTPRPAWTRKACCGAASTKPRPCSESSTSPLW
jgi:hypothetical protein